jgi:hypothetical protein
MWRRIRRLLTGVVGVLVVAALVGGLYQIRATHGDVAATPPPGNLVALQGDLGPRVALPERFPPHARPMPLRDGNTQGGPAGGPLRRQHAALRLRERRLPAIPIAIDRKVRTEP